MRSSLVVAAALLAWPHPCAARDLNPLYECARALHRSNFGLNLEFLKDDLFYFLDPRTPELYVFTPHFAGKADLARNIQLEIKRTLDAQKVTEFGFPFTPCCQSGFTYHVRLPYSQGYFYLTINDPTPVMYDDTYFGADRKMHAVRHATPIMEVGPHDARILGTPRVLADKGVEYLPLSVEGKLWDKQARDNFSAEARDLLVSQIRDGLRTPLGPDHKVGQHSDCWGHAGCDYTYTEEQVAQERQARIKTQRDIARSCKAVAGEFHLDLPPPQR